jgi:UDP-glucose 4-epimerase
MNCLVLGGNGFIGSHVTEHLRECGHKVTVFDRVSNPFVCPLSDVEYIYADFENETQLAKALAGQDVVIHLISTTVPATSNLDPVFDIQSNVVLTVKLLQACVAAGVKKVIFSSSGGTVYGIPQTLPIPESHPTNPISSYGITKLMTEKYLALFSHLYGIEYLVLRTANAYGERQNPQRKQGVITVFLWRLKHEESIRIWGDGSVVRDYIYVQDVAEACVQAAGKDTESHIFNIGSGVGRSLTEILDLLSQVTGLAPKLEWAVARPLDVPANVLTISLAQQQLGWQPTTDLYTGIQRTWDWLQTL